MSNPLQLARDALQALYTEVDRNTCRHESTHRGGAIWTICDDCGREWSDDRNPYKPWKQPALWDQVESAIAALDAAIAQRGEPVGPTDEQIERALEQWFCGEGTFQDRMRAAAACFAAPPARVPLTDEQIDALPWGPHEGNPVTFAEGLRDFARAIERAHGITGA